MPVGHQELLEFIILHAHLVSHEVAFSLRWVSISSCNFDVLLDNGVVAPAMKITERSL